MLTKMEMVIKLLSPFVDKKHAISQLPEMIEEDALHALWDAHEGNLEYAQIQAAGCFRTLVHLGTGCIETSREVEALILKALQR